MQKFISFLLLIIVRQYFINIIPKSPNSLIYHTLSRNKLSPVVAICRNLSRDFWRQLRQKLWQIIASYRDFSRFVTRFLEKIIAICRTIFGDNWGKNPQIISVYCCKLSWFVAIGCSTKKLYNLPMIAFVVACLLAIISTKSWMSQKLLPNVAKNSCAIICSTFFEILGNKPRHCATNRWTFPLGEE